MKKTNTTKCICNPGIESYVAPTIMTTAKLSPSITSNYGNIEKERKSNMAKKKVEQSDGIVNAGLENYVAPPTITTAGITDCMTSGITDVSKEYEEPVDYETAFGEFYPKEIEEEEE